MNVDLNLLEGKQHIHFIGIGGSGMYPLAQILHSKGYYLTGSDNNETETLDAVRKMGIPVFLGQRAENIEGADLIVHTAAIMSDNPELIAAKASGVPVLERSQLLGIITHKFGNSVCISGTHGKTTTTSMLTQIMVEQGEDISAVIGGKLPCIGGSGIAGKSDTMICEACEFQDHFLNLHVDTAVILNVDEDHLEYFHNLENIISSFHRFAENTTRTIIVNGDDENSVRSVSGIVGKEIVTFGFTCKNDWYPVNIIKKNGMETSFMLVNKGKDICRVTIHVPGRHNILNAVAAAAAAIHCGADAESIRNGLDKFHGAIRRFEKIGEVGGITIVDDYGHHPAELSVTLKAAAELGFNRVWAVFQPFTFSRTKILFDDFVKALSIPEKAVLTAIMGSREKNDYGIRAQDLADKISGCICFDHGENEDNPETHDINFKEVEDYLCENLHQGDLVITLGCGDVYKVAKSIYKRLSEIYGGASC